MKDFLPLLGSIAILLMVQCLRSMSRRIEFLETWIKGHKVLFKDKEEP